jgi:hypothetical protein
MDILYISIYGRRFAGGFLPLLYPLREYARSTAQPETHRRGFSCEVLAAGCCADDVCGEVMTGDSKERAFHKLAIASSFDRGAHRGGDGIQIYSALQQLRDAKVLRFRAEAARGEVLSRRCKQGH